MAVAAVAIEPQAAAGAEEDVVVAVAVVVGRGAAGVGVPHGLELELLRPLGLFATRAARAGREAAVRLHHEIEPALGSQIDEMRTGAGDGCAFDDARFHHAPALVVAAAEAATE